MGKDEHEFRAMKGAVKTIANACGLDSAAIEGLEAQTDALARRGIGFSRWQGRMPRLAPGSSGW